MNEESPSPTPRLSLKEKIGHGLGDTASHFVWDMAGMWALVFYADVYGIDPEVAALILLVARLWDVVTALIMGGIVDRTKTRGDKFRPYLLWMAIPYDVLAVMTFSIPDLSPNGKAIYAGVTYMLLMTIYLAIDLSRSSLAGAMTGSSGERASLNQYPFVFAFAGQLAVTGSALALVTFFGGGDDALGYGWTMSVFGVISVIFFFAAFLTTRERSEPPEGQKTNLEADLKKVITTRRWVALVGVGIISFTLFAMQAAVGALCFTHFIDPEAKLEMLSFITSLSENEKFNIVGFIALIAATPLAKPLASRFGNRNVYIGCSIFTSTFYGLMFLQGGDQLGLIYLFDILGKIAFAPPAPLLWTMIANTADFSEWKRNRRARGLSFSASTLSMKLRWGLGGYLSACLLGVFGDVANQERSDAALLGGFAS